MLHCYSPQKIASTATYFPTSLGKDTEFAKVYSRYATCLNPQHVRYKSDILNTELTGCIQQQIKQLKIACKTTKNLESTSHTEHCEQMLEINITHSSQKSRSWCQNHSEEMHWYATVISHSQLTKYNITNCIKLHANCIQFLCTGLHMFDCQIR